MVVNCTSNCHLLVWPISQAQWWKWQQILLKNHHYSYDSYTKHNGQNDNRFCWNSIIIQCNLPPPNYGRPLQPKLPPTRMTHTPSTMIKMTTDFVETASLSSVTYLCQITVVHCTPNCHLLVWPIYYVCFIVTHYSRSIVTHSSRSIVTNHKCSIVTQFTKNTSPLRWSFGGNKCPVFGSISDVPIFILQVKNLTEELVAVIGKCSLTRNKQEVILWVIWQ